MTNKKGKHPENQAFALYKRKQNVSELCLFHGSLSGSQTGDRHTER